MLDLKWSLTKRKLIIEKIEKMISISLYEDQSYPFYPVLNLFNKFSFTPSSAYLPFFFAVV